jgi:hypothetical protein
MYAWLWRHLPGPRPVRALLASAILLAVLTALFLWGFPWIEATFHLNEVTVG